MQTSPVYKVITVTPAVEATPDYSDGDRLGALQTLTSASVAGRSAKLVSLTLVDKSAVGEAMSILFFKSTPTIASADNAALDMTDANALLYVGHVAIATTDYVATSSNKMACIKNINLIMESGDQGNLYALARAGATINLASTSDLQFTYCFEQEAVG